MHTSCFIFFANELLFAHFIPILDYGNDVRQKAILSNFCVCVCSKWDKKQESTHNTNNALGLETTNEQRVQWWFKKFCKGDESLEEEKCILWPSEFNNNQQRIIEANPLTTTQEVAQQLNADHFAAQELNIDHFAVIWHLKQTGKVKKLDKWVSYELTANWQITIFLKWSSSVILHNKQVLDWIAMCNEKWILYNNQQPPAQRLHREVPKHFPKPNLHPKKGSWSLFGGLLLVWSTTSFWILAKPFHLRSMLSKSMGCPENCNTCNLHWSTEKARFSSTTTPDYTPNNQCFKSWTIWAMKFCLTWHI